MIRSNWKRACVVRERNTRQQCEVFVRYLSQVTMASPQHQDAGRKAPPGDEDGIGPPAKVVRVDELEASIEKILERTLKKTTQGSSITTEETQSSSTGGKTNPRLKKKKKGFSRGPSFRVSGMTNTIVFPTIFTELGGGQSWASVLGPNN